MTLLAKGFLNCKLGGGNMDGGQVHVLLYPAPRLSPATLTLRIRREFRVLVLPGLNHWQFKAGF